MTKMDIVMSVVPIHHRCTALRFPGLSDLKTLITAVLLLIVGSTHTYAGIQSSASGEPLLEHARVTDFANKVERTLANSGARVAIIARAGRPENQLPDGVRYTHVAFAVYSAIRKQDGTEQTGYAIYNLYQQPNEPDTSTLVQDYPYQFFAPVTTLKAGIIIPVPEVQKRLLQTISSDQYLTLHNPKYSVISNPYNNQTQNCTEFTLNVLQAAIYQTFDMAYVKSVTREHFSAKQLDTSLLSMLAAAAFVEGVTLTDHSGPVKTTTFGSIENYLSRYDLVKQVFHLSEST